MRNTIIGTAGHVDHGKTLLIKALTGMDTDRLREEKRRGITIQLGFAYLPLPDGRRAGIIDVPGHEKFIRNMLAGAGSIDVALLVVAAGEGFMPQTREHLDILSLLGIKRGVVAMTKVDLVDDEWRQLAAMDIEDEVRGTFLEGAPVVQVSAQTGEGIEELRQCLYRLLEEAEEKSAHTPFRLPIDRVFHMDGFGTVVTGTLIEGRLSDGDDIVVFPSMLTTKARNIQVHGQYTDTAHAGQRVAVNLSGLKCEDICKGDVLAAPDSMENSSLLDVKLKILDGAQRVITNNSRLHLYHGSRDVLCRVVLLGEDALNKGQEGYAQLRLAQPIAAKPGDRFVVRFYSPLETVGGGVILDPCPHKHKRLDERVLKGLTTKEKGSFAQRLAAMVQDRSASFPTAAHIKRRLFGEDPEFDAALAELTEQGVLLNIGQSLIHRDFLEAEGGRCQALLLEYHSQNPLHAGMRRDELRTRLLPQADLATADAVIDLLCERGYIYSREGRLAHKDFVVALSDSHKRLSQQILARFLDGGFAPPSLDEVAAEFPKEKKAFKQTTDALISEGMLVVLSPQVCMHGQHYQAALEQFAQLAAQQDAVTLAQFRDALGTSRKYAVALLEYFDRRGITKKQGDARVMA